MTIDEAIKMLNALCKETNAKRMPTITASIKLGIEALKVIEIHRTSGCLGLNFRLPGETKD